MEQINDSVSKYKALEDENEKLKQSLNEVNKKNINSFILRVLMLYYFYLVAKEGKAVDEEIEH